MRSFQITPDAVTCSTAIGACERGGLWGLAVTLLADLAKPNDACEQAAINACEQQGDRVTGPFLWVKKDLPMIENKLLNEQLLFQMSRSNQDS